MTTDSTPTVPAFEVATPYGACTVKDNRVAYENTRFATVTFFKTLKVNGKLYDSRIDFEIEPVTGSYNRINDVYQIGNGYGGYTGGLTENARTKVRDYLLGPEVFGALQRLGILAPADPDEVRDYKRERVYSSVMHELRRALHKDIDHNMSPEKRAEVQALREELMDEVLVRIVSRRLDGMTWSALDQGYYDNGE